MKNTLAQIIRLIAVSVFSTIAMSSSGCSKQLDTNIEDPDFNIKAENLKCRDPFIYYHEPSKLYYLHVNGGGKLDYYISKDLKKWKSCGSSFVPSEDFWGKQDFWAPDLYEYNGRFYIFVTLSAPGTKRGTSILVSDSPAGPFTPLVNRPITPSDHQCLDGSLYVHAPSSGFAFLDAEHLRLLAAPRLASVLPSFHSLPPLRLEERLGGAQRDREAVVRAAAARGVRSPRSLARHGGFAALFGLRLGQIGHDRVGDGHRSLRGQPIQLHATLFGSNSPRRGDPVRFGARYSAFPSHVRFVCVLHRHLPERNAPRTPAVERGDGPDVLRADSDVFNADFHAISRVQAGNAAYFRGYSALESHYS